MAVVLINESTLTDIADAIRSKNGQETLYKPSDMPDAIEAISSGGITPTGTIEITQNGVVDVTNYASADVDVPSESPSLGTKSITENGTYNASSDSLDGYSSVTVTVPQGSTPTGTKEISITQNGTTTEDVTNYASAEITVNVPSETDYLLKKITNVSSSYKADVDGVNLTNRAFDSWSNLTSVHIINCGTLGQYCFNSCSNLLTAVIRGTSSTNPLNNSNVFSSCSKLTTLDATLKSGASIGASFFGSSTSLVDTIILRSPAIVTLNNVNAISATKFKSGGAGGTIYIPKDLYDHLGDGTSSDYKAASNWSTVNGYGTITWAKIEGSQYENYYADGTPVAS